MYRHARESSRDKRLLQYHYDDLVEYKMITPFTIPQLSSSFTHQALALSVDHHSCNVFCYFVYYTRSCFFLTMTENVPVKLSDLVVYATKFC